jgi:phage shock protein E
MAIYSLDERQPVVAEGAWVADSAQVMGAVELDIREKEEHDADHMVGAVHVSRGKLEMNIEGVIPDYNTVVLCYCNANNRGALSANTLRISRSMA